MEEKGNNRIIPTHFIPFDIGCSLNLRLQEDIKQYLNQSFTEISQEDDVLKLLAVTTTHFVGAYHINEKIDLYIFDLGIGVFTVKGKVFNSNRTNYADRYCAFRKKTHEEYLKTGNAQSTTIRKLAHVLRELAAKNKTQLRISASETWEYHGLSYVMTLSHVIHTNGHVAYKNMTEQEKLDLQIMLEPSIAHKEDSYIYSCYTEVDEEKCDIALTQLDTPENLLFSEKSAVYISWSAVLLYGSDIDVKMQQILIALEIDLQAMWMKTYCLYKNLLKQTENKRHLVSQLQTELFTFRLQFNEFKRISDSNLPSYVMRIREKLLETSGINEYANDYQTELEYFIAETTALTHEAQKKYSWLNELLLFLIAFIQIAPMLYDVLANGLPSLKPIPVIIMSAIVLVATIILIKKD